MRKISLNIDDLAVESFAIDNGEKDQEGTVRSHDDTVFEGCDSANSKCATCQVGSCPQETLTCFVSCHMTDGNGCFCM